MKKVLLALVFSTVPFSVAFGNGVHVPIPLDWEERKAAARDYPLIGNERKLGCEVERFGNRYRPVAFIEVDGIRYGLNSPGVMKYGAAWDYGVVQRKGGEAQRLLNQALSLCY